MLTAVLITNGLIGFLCLFAAWKLWRLKCQLAQIANALISAEQAVHRVLYPAPGFIDRGQMGIHHLRQNYQKLGPQFQRVEQAAQLLSMGQFLWQRAFRVDGLKFNKKSLRKGR